MVIEKEILANSTNSTNTNLINQEITLTTKEKDYLAHKPDFISSVEKLYLKNQVYKIQIGDLVKIGVSIKEGNKDRIQYYQGLVLGKNSTGINSTITVRKVFQGIGVERKFLIHSPKFESIEILKSSRVRRSKLYYLRNFSEKESRLKPRFTK